MKRNSEKGSTFDVTCCNAEFPGYGTKIANFVISGFRSSSNQFQDFPGKSSTCQVNKRKYFSTKAPRTGKVLESRYRRNRSVTFGIRTPEIRRLPPLRPSFSPKHSSEHKHVRQLPFVLSPRLVIAVHEEFLRLRAVPFISLFQYGFLASSRGFAKRRNNCRRWVVKSSSSSSRAS